MHIDTILYAMVNVFKAGETHQEKQLSVRNIANGIII